MGENFGLTNCHANVRCIDTIARRDKQVQISPGIASVGEAAASGVVFDEEYFGGFIELYHSRVVALVGRCYSLGCDGISNRTF
jgi:hypothetical protein